MAKEFIELDSAGIQELLKSDEIAEICEQQAERLTRATGMRYVSDVRVGKTRVNARGYQKQSGPDGSDDVCPKCGRSHPNCRCRTKKK